MLPILYFFWKIDSQALELKNILNICWSNNNLNNSKSIYFLFYERR